MRAKLVSALPAILLIVSGGAFASAKCTAHPKSEWMKESDAKAQLEAAGYKIRKFKVDGNCYEIYGHNKEGKKVEIYFDTKTLDVVKSEIEK
ncbi:PepSY domain-containing protein [Noviherbaspirillum galbum]|uniref:PepSY domain-containing protein n=1 Tax=Noviherbaspirillum galbum TaxID=2709383 RepID=A0A6B3SS91_9BURK|nr:PepSY domain-containing protein [Noviherbaspirillum galbum]NEX61676.1 PepSY domain-containing protein [Noviherbaspirillum galbum]